MDKLLMIETKETPTRWKVSGVHYVPHDPQYGVDEATIDANLLISTDLPIPENRLGKNPQMYADPTTMTVTIEYVDRPLTHEEKLQQLQAEKDALEQRLAQMNGNFTAFIDQYYIDFPEKA